MASKYSWLNWKKEQVVPVVKTVPKCKPKNYEGEPFNDLDKALYTILKCLDGIEKVSAKNPPEIGVHWALSSGWQGFVVNGVHIHGLTSEFQGYWYQTLSKRNHQKYLKTLEEKAFKAISQYKSVNGLSHLS